MASADEAIKQASNVGEVHVGETCLTGSKYYEALKDLDFEWDDVEKHWKAQDSKDEWHYIGANSDGPGKKVVSCGTKPGKRSQSV